MKKQIFYLIIILLTICDIIFLSYIAFYPANSSFIYYVVLFDLILCIVMWIEFAHGLFNADNKKQYMKDNAIGILGMIPFNSLFIRALRFVKLAQLIRIFVMLRYDEQIISKFLKETYLDKIIFISIIFIVIISFLILIVDPNITTLPMAVWYVFVSMTSTGYGDVVPSNLTGRLIGMITMVGGIVIFATITAVISSIYVSKLQRDHREDLESKVSELTDNAEKLNSKIDELTDEIGRLNKKIDELNKKL